MKKLSACPVCGSPAEGCRAVHDRPDHSLRRCRSCGSLFADPQYETHELAGIADAEFYSEELTAQQGRTAWGALPDPLPYEVYGRTIVSRYPHLGRPGLRVLDYGCGLGQFLNVMKERGARCLGVELSDIAARHVRERLGIRVITGDEGCLAEQADESFDLATLFSVLEHVRSPASLMALLHRKLVPGGVLCAVVPSVGSLQYTFLRGRWKEVRTCAHLTIFSMRGMKRLLSEAGFVRVKRLVFYGGRPGFGPLKSLAQYFARTLGLGGAISVCAEKPTEGPHRSG